MWWFCLIFLTAAHSQTLGIQKIFIWTSLRSQDTSLSQISSFDNSLRRYEIPVDYQDQNVRLQPYLLDGVTTLSINGMNVTLGSHGTSVYGDYVTVNLPTLNNTVVLILSNGTHSLKFTWVFIRSPPYIAELTTTPSIFATDHFDKGVYRYVKTVGSDVDTLNISLVKALSTDKVTVGGAQVEELVGSLRRKYWKNISLSEGENNFDIVVASTSEVDAKATYSFSITKSGSSDSTSVIPRWACVFLTTCGLLIYSWLSM
eukprot:gb/GEZN01015823.1/.p1 GENE.gb/GEZN01015823.1/~~gb/GEZN01015823.1/.p1  ORF type:complete len:270 (+),score=31.00 gb/GEZN01015823.1/:36-812(+)